MRKPLLWMALTGTGLLCAALLCLWLALAATPAIDESKDLRYTDVQRVLQIARAHDPRRAVPGRVNAVALSERDLDLLLNHAAHRWLGARMSVRLARGSAVLQASSEWPGSPFGRWVNVEVRWRESAGMPVLEAWRVGRLPLPAWLASPLMHAALARSFPGLDHELVGQVAKRVRFFHEHMNVVYVWQDDTSSRLLSALTPTEDTERLRAYSDRLVALAGRDDTQWTVTLPELIAPMFELARQRSLGGDAAKENRAAILTLAAFATGRGLGTLVPAARAWPQPRRLHVTLQGRDDFTQHFLLSAALVTESTSPLASAIGLHKEVADSQGGSGFSFNDMAANRAGTRFGQLALRDPARLQDLLAAGVREDSLLPDMAGLPELLSAGDFARRFGGVGGAGYERMQADIERRVGALPLYR